MRTNPSRHVLVLTLALALGLAGCASSGGGGTRIPGSSSNRIVRAELDALEGALSAHQAIVRLRPRWLQARGVGTFPPVLYVSGSRRGDLDDLRAMQAAELEQMEYMSPSDATTRFGTGHTGGAILVTNRRR